MDVSLSSPTESSTPLSLNAIRNRVKELSGINYSTFFREDTDAEDLHSNYVSALECRLKEFESEYAASFLADDFDTLTEYLQEELSSKVAERSKLSNEIKGLEGNLLEAYADYSQLQGELESLSCSMDLIDAQGLEAANAAASVDSHTCKESQLSLINGHGGQKLEIFRLEDQEKDIKRLKESFLYLDFVFKGLDARQEMEETLTGLKVIEFDEKYIRLSLQREIPNLENFCHQTSRLTYELVIELSDGTMDVEKAKIIPDDVYIDDIIDASKFFRQTNEIMLDTRSGLEWFVGHVLDRVLICTTRRLLVENANKSRHSFEYIDRDEIIVAHMVGGVDVFIKVSSGWPITQCPLNLFMLKDTDQHLKRVSSKFFCRIEEATNCLDLHVRQDLLSFANAVEMILAEQMQMELHSDATHDE